MEQEYITADELESLTTVPASTWRYWASVGQGPPSQRIGRRRVWLKASALEWLQQQPARK